MWQETFKFWDLVWLYKRFYGRRGSRQGGKGVRKQEGQEGRDKWGPWEELCKPITLCGQVQWNFQSMCWIALIIMVCVMRNISQSNYGHKEKTQFWLALNTTRITLEMFTILTSVRLYDVISADFPLRIPSYFFLHCSQIQDWMRQYPGCIVPMISQRIWWEMSVPLSTLWVGDEIDHPIRLTHCGLVTPYGDTDLGQHWLR